MVYGSIGSSLERVLQAVWSTRSKPGSWRSTCSKPGMNLILAEWVVFFEKGAIRNWWNQLTQFCSPV